MRECWSHRRRNCSRPPRRVHIGDQPFQVKQLSYAVPGEEGWEEHGGCGCLNRPDIPMRPHPPFWWDREDEPEIPVLPAAENGEIPEDRDFPGKRRPRPPFWWGNHPHVCPPCNLTIKVLKLNGCGKAEEGAAIGLFRKGRLLRAVETNSHGEAVFSHLLPGMYTVEELDLQDGTDVDTTRYAVFLGTDCHGVTVVLKKGNCRRECPDRCRFQPEPPNEPEISMTDVQDAQVLE